MTVARRSIAARAAVLACTGVLAGCTLITDSFLTNEFSGDPFPIQIDTTSGALIVGLRQAERPDRTVVLDLLSPFTLSDPGADTPPSVAYVDLTLLGQRAPGGPLDLPRARFPGAQLVSLHPCDTEPCFVGPDGPDDPSDPNRRRPFQGILGADVLAGDAVRLRLGDNQMFVLPDVAGSDRGRSLSCEAVFRSPYRGGGTLVFSTTELAFGNRRITLQTCLGPDPAPPPNPTGDLAARLDPDAYRPRGADVLLVVSTGIGISILTEAAYERYRLSQPEPRPPELAALGVASVYLPSGLVTGRRATVTGLALVAGATSNALAPCRQVYAHRLLTTFALTDAACKRDARGNAPFDCPCDDGTTFCAVPAIVELIPPPEPPPARGIDVLVVPDDNPTLQALRTELRPDQAEVDGLLGTDVLRALEIDVDYPHDRLITRCAGGDCRARPQLATSTDICQINRCTWGTEDARGCAPGTLPDPLAPP